MSNVIPMPAREARLADARAVLRRADAAGREELVAAGLALIGEGDWIDAERGAALLRALRMEAELEAAATERARAEADDALLFAEVRRRLGPAPRPRLDWGRMVEDAVALTALLVTLTAALLCAVGLGVLR